MRTLFVLLAGALSLATAPLPGTVLVEPATGAVSAETGAVFAAAVSDALGQAEFVPIRAPGRGRYVARVVVTREQRGMVASRAPAVRPTAVIGGWSAAARLALPSSKTQLRGLYATSLEVTLYRREDNSRVWGGRALTVQVEDSRADTPQALANTLAGAIVAYFPNQSDERIAVP